MVPLEITQVRFEIDGPATVEGSAIPLAVQFVHDHPPLSASSTAEIFSRASEARLLHTSCGPVRV